MDLYFNKETKEYVFVDNNGTLTVSELEFNEMKKAGMSGVLLKLARDQRRQQDSQNLG